MICEQSCLRVLNQQQVLVERAAGQSSLVLARQIAEVCHTQAAAVNVRRCAAALCHSSKYGMSQALAQFWRAAKKMGWQAHHLQAYVKHAAEEMFHYSQHA